MPDRERGITQYAPWPAELEVLVTQLRYRPGWKFSLEEVERDHADVHSGAAGGLTFMVLTKTQNSYHVKTCETCNSPVTDYRVYHYFPVPAATYNRASWMRWLLNCLLQVEQHEATEFFAIDGKRPFAPTHGPGDDPYVIVQYASDEQRRTAFTGALND